MAALIGGVVLFLSLQVGQINPADLSFFANERDSRATLAAMKSDLRNLMSVQEIYYGDHEAHADDLTSLEMRLSDDVELLELRTTAGGYGARVTHRHNESTCAVFIGERPFPPAESAGSVTCDRGMEKSLRGGAYTGAFLALVLALAAVGLGAFGAMEATGGPPGPAASSGP